MDDQPVIDPPAVNTLATIGRRFGAWLIDGVVLSPVMLLLLALTGAHPEDGIEGIPQLVLSGFWVVLVAYHVGFVAHSGQTLGKRWLRIKVVDATTGAVPNLDQAGRRAAPVLIQIIPVIGAFGPLLYAPALWRPRRQGLHDRLAATVVVNV